MLFHPTTGKFIMLNASAASIWSELATPRTERELADTLCSRFADIDPSAALRDARDAVSQLLELQLVAGYEG